LHDNDNDNHHKHRKTTGAFKGFSVSIGHIQPMMELAKFAIDGKLLLPSDGAEGGLTTKE
jgi:hypothetical protein